MAEATELKMWHRGHLNAIICLYNFMKFHKSVQFFLVGDTQTGDLISYFNCWKVG
jgi:hypothetical protein